MKRNEILGEHKKGTKAVKYNKKPKDHTAEFSKAKEKLAPQKPLEEGSGPKEKQKTPYRDINSPEYRAAVDKQKQRMAKDKAAEPGKKMLAKQGAAEGYNPNSASAEHRRKLDQSHAADLKARADAPDATERDQQRYQNYLDKKEQMANDYNDRMERESVAQEGHRDYDDNRTGFGDQGKREFKRREMEHELGHETNNYAVAIDGRTWKVFADKNHAQAVARSLQNKGKKASVHETGAEPTTEAMGAEVGKITKVDPTTKKATLTKTDGSSMEVDSTALKPTPDGKMSMDTPDADELKMGTAVVSTEDMTAPTVDSSSPINGDEENVDLRRLQELAGKLTERGPVTAHPDYEDANSSFGQVQSMMGADRMQVPSMGPFAGKITAVSRTGEIVGLWADGAWKGGKALDKFRPTSEPAANTSDSAPFVPKDYQTKEPLTKGPDGKWYNKAGQERDNLHGGPIGPGGGAMFRSLTPRAAPTPAAVPESSDLTAMLRIAGLR